MNKKIMAVIGLTLLFVPMIATNVNAIDTVPLPDSPQSLVAIDTVPLPDNPQSLVAIDTVPLPDSPQSLVAIGTWPTPEETITSEDAIIVRENPVINPGEETTDNNEINNPDDNNGNNIRNDINNLSDPDRDNSKQKDKYDLKGRGFKKDINPWIQ